MNVLTRGVKNTLRSPLRTGAIVLMFAISIALIMSMLVARSSVLTKINEVKATAGTGITIRPAGTMGDQGGGNPLTAAQLQTIQSTAHISSTNMTLNDRLASTDTNLTSSLTFGSFGRRFQQQSDSAGTDTTGRTAPSPGITVTGTNNVDSVATNGGALTISSGNTIDPSSSDNVALVGSDLATKNNLSPGSTFTAYGTTITVKGIYTTGTTFQDSGIVMPLATVQALTNQAGVVSSVTANVDSSDNVSATVTSLKNSLGSAADITSDVQRAESSVQSLEGIASLALTGVIAAAIAGAAIILLAMTMIVRERRREIGVMKAIGGTDGKVVGQFITEGLTLTVFGALIGIALGILVSGPMTTSLVSNSQSSSNSQRASAFGPGGATASSTTSTGGQGGGFFRGGLSGLRNNATQVTASLTPQIIFIALGVTVLISLIGTAIPAWLTARVRPAEVLRTE
ncbi:MAG TPA: FtsX-like permease family protein [Dongiaceae bacterium]|nr:FtsX-like permease family protein [Dongiaceae bacterium]